MTTNKLPEWRKALNKSVENYQSAQAWYEENQDSPSAEQDVDTAAGEIEKLLKQYGVLIVLSLLDEIAELQEHRAAVEDKDLLGVIDALEHPAGINAAGKQVVRRALAELQERRKADSAEPVSFDALNVAVAEVTGGNQHAWDTAIYKGHHPVPFMNYNSLARIVDKYRVPQPAPAVPDEKRDDDGNVTSDFDHGWNACRAAMLQGADGN